jgi:mannose-6-phosphate isomerase-like protein (cupin superfamily)
MLKNAFVCELENNGEYQPILNGKPQTCGMRSGKVYLAAGQTCGQHSTNAYEEMLVFLSGQGEALIGEENKPHVVGKGKVLYIPPHTPHDIRNSGQKLLVYIYCVAPIISESEESK